MNSGENSAVPIVSSSNSASHEHEGSESMSSDSSWKMIAKVSEWLKSSRSLDSWLEKMVCRHGTTLLVLRECTGFNPRPCRYGRWASKDQVESGREEVEDGEKQEEDKHEDTDAQTHFIIDNMKMGWNAHTDNDSSWLMQWECTCLIVCKVHEKMTCEMYLSTHPVGYSGSQKQTKRLLQNVFMSSTNFWMCPTRKRLRKSWNVRKMTELATNILDESDEFVFGRLFFLLLNEPWWRWRWSDRLISTSMSLDSSWKITAQVFQQSELSSLLDS